MKEKPEKKMKNLLPILKDKLSILKSTLSLSSKPTTSFHVAVLRATTLHHPLNPPPLDAVLALAHHHRPSAVGTLLHTLLHRLHGTHSAYVALKCLLTFHHVITHGSPVLQEQVLDYSSGPLFNLSNFNDESDRDTWELSSWVRWYADVLDHKLFLTRLKKVKNLNLNLDYLVGFLEKISGAPDSLHYQKLTLIFEVMKLVGEDYRMIMREISEKINLIKKKLGTQDFDDIFLENLLNDLKRIVNCKEKVVLMFLNKKKNDGVWELIEEVKRDVEEVRERREKMRVVSFHGGELTRVVGERVSELKALAVVPSQRVKRWLDVDWNPLVLSSA